MRKATMKPAIKVANLSVSFAVGRMAVEALSGLNLTVAQGEVVGFLGPNGAGKTTTIHVLLGFIGPTSGSARVFGEDVGKSIARERIGYLPEHPETYKFLTGRELLRMAGRLFHMTRHTLKQRVEEVLDMVDLKSAAGRRIGTYSRGMMQRIGLAQALINDPDLVILDEPTGGLDPIGRMDVREIIAKLRERGKTVFFSSHELSEVEMVCDHIAILSDGRLVAEGAVSDLVGTEKNLERYFLETIQKAREKKK
jgi:ABC-2 type transport system ATP-binding protein